MAAPRQIPLTFGTLYHLDELVYSEAACLADPDAQHLAPAFTSAISQGELMFAKERTARRSVTQKEAEVGIHNKNLDTTTTRFAHITEAHDPELLPKLLDSPPGEFVRQSLRIQCEKTRDVIVPSLSKLPADHPSVPFGPILLAGATKALSALDERGQAKGGRTMVGNEADEWKESVNALRNITYADLLKIEVEKKKGKGWARAFFRKVTVRRAKPQEDADVESGEAESGEDEG